MFVVPDCSRLVFSGDRRQAFVPMAGEVGSLEMQIHEGLILGAALILLCFIVSLKFMVM